jgi:hypothetical protein
LQLSDSNTTYEQSHSVFDSKRSQYYQLEQSSNHGASIESSFVEKNKYREESVIKYLFKNHDESENTLESKSKLRE